MELSYFLFFYYLSLLIAIPGAILVTGQLKAGLYAIVWPLALLVNVVVDFWNAPVRR